MDELRHRAHVNLIDSSRQLFELDSGVRIEAGDGWLLGAGTSSNPAISNAAFRVDDGLDPAELLTRAREFFGRLGRGFSLWTRGDAEEDRDLLEAATAQGLNPFFEMPEMVLDRRPEEAALPDGVEMRRLTNGAEAERLLAGREAVLCQHRLSARGLRPLRRPLRPARRERGRPPRLRAAPSRSRSR